MQFLERNNFDHVILNFKLCFSSIPKISNIVKLVLISSTFSDDWEWMDPYFAVISRAFFRLDRLAIVACFEIEASPTFDVGRADWLDQGIVIEDLKVTILDAGLQIKLLANRPVAVNHVSCMASIFFKDIEIQAFSGFCKELSKMISIIIKYLHDNRPLGNCSYFVNSVGGWDCVLNAVRPFPFC